MKNNNKILKTSFIAILLTYLFNFSFSQDTIKILTYNLLNFNNITQNCNESNNPILTKVNSLTKILNYTKPDIIGLNEIGSNEETLNILKNQVLNKIDGKNYSLINYISPNSNITNVLIYNNKKFILDTFIIIPTPIRETIYAKLFYNSPDLQLGDTVFIQPIVTHLKAGSSLEDQEKRNQQTEVLMNNLSNLKYKKNLILMGDLNVYSSTEQCFQNLINYPVTEIKFFDPINKLGNWHNNQNYALYHTQSTRLNSNDCFSGGGLNDRFDFILLSFHIINNTNKVSYVSNSYKTLGQDGYRFNQELIYPINYSEPHDIIDALYQLSDHLPVTLKLVIHQTPYYKVNHNYLQNELCSIYYYNNSLNVNCDIFQSNNTNLEIFDVSGKSIFKKTIHTINSENFKIPIHLKKGIYILKISNLNYNITNKLIVN